MKHFLRILVAVTGLIFALMSIDQVSNNAGAIMIPFDELSTVIDTSNLIFDVEVLTLSDDDAELTCSLSKKTISKGMEYVRINGKIFSKDVYDNAKKCSLSGLPLTGREKLSVNLRTKTAYLKRYKKRGHTCFSCLEHSLTNHEINGDYICNYCAKTSVNSNSLLIATAKKVEQFFIDEGLTIPVNIEYIVDSTFSFDEEELGGEMGLCKTHGTSTGDGKFTYTHEISIKKGLSKEQCESVLAHEIAHAIANESLGVGKDKLAEGRAQYASYIYLQKNSAKQYLIDMIIYNVHPDYAKPFKQVNKKGLPLKDVLTVKRI